jgi:syntaxin 18
MDIVTYSFDQHLIIIVCFNLVQSKNIASLRQILKENQAAFCQPGLASSKEISEIEGQIRSYISQCNINIEKLQHLCNDGTISAAQAMERAHRQGCVLILAEHLKDCISRFEAMQRARVSRLEQIEMSKRRRTPPPNKSWSRAHPEQDPISRLRTMALGSQNETGDALQQQDVQIRSENLALQQELASMSDQVQRAEQSVREIASLNQAFSAAVFHQAEQIETLYNEAVAATSNIGQGNIQLEKTIRVNKSSRKCMMVLLFLFSLGLLFVDWFYS